MPSPTDLAAMLRAAIGPDVWAYLAGAAGLVLVVIAGMVLASKKEEPLDRIAGQRQRPDAEGGKVVALNRHGRRNAHLARYAKYLDIQDEAELGRTREMLVQAGYVGKDAVRTLMAAQFALGGALLCLGLAYVFLVAPAGLSAFRQFAYVVGPGASGYYLPRYWVRRRMEARRDEIRQGFPDALDLLLICVEAGQSLDQSINRVATEIASAYPALAGEFRTVAEEMKAGRDKAEVLRAMAQRCDIADISAFVTVLIQSASFGTSVAEALRVYAAEMRDKRIVRAEEKANVLPTKLTVGTMMFCVPPLLIILIGPSLHGIAETLGGGGVGF